MDALSDVLRVVQLTGAVFLHGALSAPWCVIARMEPGFCALYLPPSERVVSFHLVTEGSCWVMLPNEPGSRIPVDAGDLIVVPQGEPHVLGSSTDLPPEQLAPLLPFRGTTPGEVMTLTHGGGGAVTRLLCGFLAAQDIARNPLLAALPRLFKVGMRGSSASWLEASMRFATEQSVASTSAGSATVLAKLSELVFVEAVRRYVDTLPDDSKGWLAGLRDRFVARALALMHARPAHPWTVDELAQNIGVSRSALARRFTDLLEVPPMQYLAQWRLQLAAQQLRLTDRSLVSVAQDVGYESEAAFNRAFKREFGVPPATWRRKAGGVS